MRNCLVTVFQRTHVFCHPKFSPSLILQQIRNNSVDLVDMAEEQEKCYASAGRRFRKHPKSRGLWILFAMGPLPVTRFYVWSEGIKRVHHCCLWNLGKLSPNRALFLLLLSIEKDDLINFSRYIFAMAIIGTALEHTSSSCELHCRISAWCFRISCSM